MKANELMIGDWVKVTDDDTDDSFIGQVKAIDELENINVQEGEDVAYPYSIDCLEPIPLTPEILEKNGFDFIKNDNTKSVWNGWWIYEGLELATACLDKEGNWPCFINIYDSNIECEYVHQLQHALRLCGIDKTIEL